MCHVHVYQYIFSRCVLVSNAEPPPDSSSLESQLGFSIEEPEPDTSSLESQIGSSTEEPEPDTSSLESQIDLQ